MTQTTEDILRTLDQQGELTPNRIGRYVFPDAQPVHGSGHGNGRGSGHRVFGEAQRVIFPLNRLKVLGLVYVASRSDGLSGTAYGITPEGKEAIS